MLTPGLAPDQLSCPESGEGAGAQTDRSGAQEARQRRKNNAVPEYGVAAVPLRIPYRETEMVEQPDPVGLGGSVRPGQVQRQG